MKEVWKFLDGNKTVFGLIMLTVSAHLDPGLTADLLNTVGGILTGVGAVHKVVKKKQEASG